MFDFKETTFSNDVIGTCILTVFSSCTCNDNNTMKECEADEELWLGKLLSCLRGMLFMKTHLSPTIFVCMCVCKCARQDMEISAKLTKAWSSLPVELQCSPTAKLTTVI